MSSNLRLRILLPFTLLLIASACQITQPTAPAQPREERKTRSASRPTRAPKADTSRTSLSLSAANGRPGTAVSVSVRLSTGGASIAGTQNDIVFDPAQVAIAPTAKNKPDCRPNSGLGKEATAFSYLPASCRPGRGGTCTSVRALVLSLSNVDPIPNGSVLYTCNVQIAPNARVGAQKLTNTRVGFSSPDGQAVPGTGSDGTITVEGK